MSEIERQLVKIVPKSLGDARQDICKDKECCWLLKLKLSRVKLNFSFACMFTSKGIFNAVKKVVHMASAMECPYGDKQDRIYFARSNGGVLWCKNKTLALVKTLWTFGISRGVGGLRKKSLPWGRYGYFLELHNIHTTNIISYCENPKTVDTGNIYGTLLCFK